MVDLQQSRAAIDRIDAELARLFEARMEAAAEIAVYKQAMGLPIRDPAREAVVLAQNADRITDPALRPYYAALLQALMGCSRDYQAEFLQPDSPERIGVRNPEGRCPVILRRGCLAQAGALLNLNRRVFLVIDEGVPTEFARSLATQCGQAACYPLPRGEASKSPARLGELLEAMLDFGMNRSDCVLVLGGGVAGDLAGLAAALYMRGIDWYNCPSTSLSMVDSSIGGKTAVNLGGVKNSIGAFHNPSAVLIDPALLESLPRRELVSGLAEAVKMGLTHDAALFERFEDPAGYGAIESIIAAALRVKRAVVEADPREGGLRRVLNFGHTLGHGIEAASDGALLHGECVGLGMLPLCAPAVRTRLRTVLERLGLPTSLKGLQINPERVLAAILHDKKTRADGSISVVMVPEPGHFELRRLSPEALRELIACLFEDRAPSAPFGIPESKGNLYE
ncbi:MAG: iron-containing alcohol dehydrogenase [Oscillospiraceae bacterium]|nr:iron-containing alcohol dehydrogenase [Oscillospiraceae bacterium]